MKYKSAILPYTGLHSRDLRLRVIKHVKDGRTLAQTIQGNAERKFQRLVNKKIIPKKLIEYVEAHPDGYLKEIEEVFGCCPSSVLKYLRKLGITRKKDYALQKAESRKIAAYLDAT